MKVYSNSREVNHSKAEPWIKYDFEFFVIFFIRKIKKNRMSIGCNNTNKKQAGSVYEQPEVGC